MPAVQIPLWVTYSLAVIAILGPIGGALIGGKITAARDDRRWEREATREDLRWQREHARFQEQRAHDARIEWRLQRFEVYQRFLAAVDAFQPAGWYVIVITSTERPFPNDQEEGDRQTTHLVEMRRALAAVEFVAGGSALRLARALEARATEVNRLIAPNELTELLTPELNDAQKKARLREFVEDFSTLRAAFVNEVKHEVALEVSGKDSSIPIQTQSSETSS